MPKNQSIPGISILRNGTEVSSELVYSVSIEFGFSTLPKATIHINDGNRAQQTFAESEKEEWQVGETVEIKVGYNQQFDLVFSGVIIKQGIGSSEDQNSKLYLELRHRYYLSSIKKSSRIFLEKKDSEAIEEIISEYGFKKEIDASQEVQRQLVQFNSSDWDFMNLRAEANNMFVIPKNDTFILKSKISAEEEKVKLIFGTNISKFNLETDSRYSFETFRTKSWDANNQEVTESESSESPTSTAGSASAAQIAEKSKHGIDEILGLGSLTEMESTSISNRNKVNAELSKIRGTIKCLGNNDTSIGDYIKLEGVGTQFSGKILVTGILHELSAGRWYTTYQIGTNPEKFANQFDDIIEKPASGLLPGVNGLQIGIVSKLESDQDDDKILVQLPNLKQGEDAVWARCARMEAGNERGWVFRPEIGDEVILGFINDDPRQSVILGSLHSSKNVSPIIAADNNNHKGYTSREKLKFLFDDDKKIISILTPIATIELDDDAKKITIKNEINSIEMGDDGIKMETQKDFKLKATGDIDLEGMNVKLKANAQFSAEGSAGTKVSSSAITEIKGSLVNIN